MKSTREKNRGITLVALVITIILLLILAGITISSLKQNGILTKAGQAVEKTKYADAKESLQLMLLRIKTRVIAEEKRNTKTTDCNELEGEDGIIKIEYTNEGTSEYALVTYKNYIFKVDEELNIIESDKQEEIVDDVIAGGGKYIYNRGRISEEAKSFVGVNDINSEYAINNEYLYMNIRENNCNDVYVGTEQKISLGDYTKIKCLVSTGDGLSTSSNRFCLTINNIQVSNISNVASINYNSKQIGANQTEYVLEFEIPDECFNKECYIGAVASLKDVYIYKIWLERAETKILYDYGKISEEAKSFIGVNDVNSEYAINDEDLYMNILQDNCNETYVGTEQKISLEDYTKIKCLVSTGDGLPTSSNSFYLTLDNNQISNISNITNNIDYKSKAVGANQTEHMLKLEIPDKYFNKECYIGAIGTLKDIHIYKIWLEK